MLRIASLLLILAATATSQTIRFATIAPEGSTWMKVLKNFDREVQKRTGRKVKFKFFAGAIKGDEKTVIKQMKTGSVDGAGFAGLGMGEISGEARVLDLPFLLKTDEEVDHLFGKMFNRIAAEFDKKGFVLLGFSEVGFVHIFSRQRIDSLDALRKSKCWTWAEDPVAATALQKIGANPVPLTLADVFTSLQTGVINTFYSPPLGAIAMQWFTKVKYFQTYPMTHSTGGLVMTKSSFNRLSREHQAVLKKAAKKHMKRLVSMTRRENAEALEELKKAGLEFIPRPSDAELKEYEKIGQAIRDELKGKVFSKEILNEVLTALAQFRKGA
jgi:TRAP-type C4-dicarboxylate transport system substrate-binding protein